MEQSSREPRQLPRPANEMPLSPVKRSDADTARQVFSNLYPDATLRTDVERLVADLISAAHTSNPESWSVTLFGDALRLMVGWQTVLYLRRNSICVAIHEAGQNNPLPDVETAQLERIGTLGSITNDVEAIEVNAHHWSAVRDVVRPRAVDTVRFAAGLNRFSRFVGTHSAGVVDYLRASLSQNVPHSEHRRLKPPGDRPSAVRCWKISAGKGASGWSDFKDRGIVAMYWEGSPDWRSYTATSADELKQQLLTAEFAQGTNIHSASREVWQFLREMQPGDSICVYGNKQVYGWGEITSDYWFEDDDFEFPHRRSVRWRKTDAVSVSPLSEDLQAKLKRVQTIVPLDPNEFTRIRQLWSDSPSPSPSAAITTLLGVTGLTYTGWQVASFLSGLQTKGFVILSGISGTGKTKLVQQFSHLLSGQAVASVEVDTSAEIVLTVHQYMLKYARFAVPQRAFQFFSFPIGETREIDVRLGSTTQKCRITREDRDTSNVTFLFLRGAVRKAFEEHFQVGDRFVIDPTISDDLELTGIRIVSEAERVNSIHSSSDSQSPITTMNSLFLSVRPDWRDSKSLLGYYNPLAQMYEWTPFLRFLLRARQSYEARDGLAWFVVLDEMNLAHVEYYFADMLSVLESGRAEDGYTREPLRLVYPDTLDVTGDVPPRELTLPPNLYIVGTVNIDETTHAFSPKVLDRAFSIELVDVDFSDYPPRLREDAVDLSDEQRWTLLMAFTRNGQFHGTDKGRIGAYVDEHPEVRERLQTLNTLLRPHMLHFGYRVFDEIMTFLANADENGMFAEIGGQEAAFDAAVLMKVLPKFNGSRGKLERPLELVLAWCANPDAPNVVAVSSVAPDAVGSATAFSGESFRLRRTAERVWRMLDEVRMTGFTAFG